jgi:predicted metal-dependent HD superfamily phosphohydrolase
LARTGVRGTFSQSGPRRPAVVARLARTLGRMYAPLLSSWDRAWSGLQAQSAGTHVRDAVLARYAEPQRKYHTLQHLAECLSLFESIQHAPDRPAEVEMALWFHDAIYDPKGTDNEARSAAWSEEELRKAGVAEEPASRVAELILVTKHTRVPQTRDAKVLVDIDLAILGASEERFAEYESQIREEYSHVPELLFRLKRREILQSFLDRSAIYSTPTLHQQLEARARTNLAAAVGKSE